MSQNPLISTNIILNFERNEEFIAFTVVWVFVYFLVQNTFRGNKTVSKVTFRARFRLEIEYKLYCGHVEVEKFSTVFETIEKKNSREIYGKYFPSRYVWSVGHISILKYFKRRVDAL